MKIHLLAGIAGALLLVGCGDIEDYEVGGPGLSVALDNCVEGTKDYFTLKNNRNIETEVQILKTEIHIRFLERREQTLWSCITERDGTIISLDSAPVVK